MSHISVMLNEILKGFENVKLRNFFEGTVGAGGHAEAILRQHEEIENYYACDRDPKALEIARIRLKKWEKKIEFIHGNFALLDEFLSQRGVTEVDGFFLI